MKKNLTVLVCIIMIISLGGCGNNKENSNAKDTTKDTKSQITEKKNIEIVDSGYYVTKGDSPFVKYGIIIKNPNDKYGIEFPSINIAMYDKDGKILGNHNQTLMYIGPGETLAYGGQASPNGKKPDKVQFTIKKDENKYSEASKKDSPFKISNTNDIVGEYGDITCTGEIENISDKNYDSVAVSLILYKNKKIIYGTTTYVDTVNAKSKVPFEVSSLGGEVPKYDSYKIYAQPW